MNDVWISEQNGEYNIKTRIGVSFLRRQCCPHGLPMENLFILFQISIHFGLLQRDFQETLQLPRPMSSVLPSFSLSYSLVKILFMELKMTICNPQDHPEDCRHLVVNCRDCYPMRHSSFDKIWKTSKNTHKEVTCDFETNDLIFLLFNQLILFE